MPKYIENPKTKGSGIYCAIPQKGSCPLECDDCFYNGGNSYLEPLEVNTPNLPDSSLINYHGFVVRVNDGNDSNVEKKTVIAETSQYREKFYNTSIPDLDFPAPVVMTINPGKMTDEQFWAFDPIPANLMFVRLRVNSWNVKMCTEAVKYYTDKGIPVVISFMRYDSLETVPHAHRPNYERGKHVTNEYWMLTARRIEEIMMHWKYNSLVFLCGDHHGCRCSQCGICLREYFATKARMA